ncbi:F-box/LRR-repeat protein 7, partial [Frankliniella fusca]
MESLRRERDRLYRTVPVAQTPRRHVDDLPDHILLRIFSLLDHAHLADVVVAVCKRWCNLVHEPSLWDRATLVYGNSKGVHTGAVAFIRTLAAATTLLALECGLSPADPHFVLHQLENCNTAASHVCFDLDTAAADAVLRVLWNSRAVLKELCVREGPLGQSDFSYSQACRFWEILEESPQLRTLVLFLRQSGGLANSLYSFRPSGCPSLRTLCLDVGVVEEHAMWTKPQLHIVASTIASTLIAAHRATLEDVRLPMRVMSSSKVVKALSRCPLLGRARLPVCLELHHLARCERLTELHLTSDYMQSAFNTEHLLQSICQLRQLQRLTVSPVGRCSDSLAVANGLIAALGELVELRRLYLTCLPTAEALDVLAASPTKAPHLELLHFSQSCGEAADGPCRLPALRRLLQWRRQLHVSMLSLKVHHGDVGPRCGKDHCTLAANNPDLPVVFVNHEVQGDQECAACETCAGFMRDVGGSILYLIEDSEFLDLPWRDASDLSVSSTPARGVPASTLATAPTPTPTPAHAPTLVPALPPALALTYVSSKEKGLAEPDKESRLALPALGQPGKAKTTKASAKSGQAVKKPKPRAKANPKPKSNPKPKAQPGPKKSAKKPSQKKVSPAASGSRVATVK